MDNYYKWMMEAEAAVILRNPVYEAEYMVETLEWNLNLYDCYVPRLKEFHTHKLAYTPAHYLRQSDLQAKEREFLRSELRSQKEKNSDL